MNTIDRFGRSLNFGKRSEVVLRRAGDALSLEADGHFSARNKRIKLMHAPEHASDAVSRQWVEERCIREIEGRFSVGKKRLTDLRQPEHPDDAAPRSYVDKHLLKETPEAYEFSAKRLSNIREPVEPSDAVSKRWVEMKFSALKSEYEQKIEAVMSEYKSLRSLVEGKTSSKASNSKKVETRKP